MKRIVLFMIRLNTCLLIAAFFYLLIIGGCGAPVGGNSPVGRSEGTPGNSIAVLEQKVDAGSENGAPSFDTGQHKIDQTSGKKEPYGDCRVKIYPGLVTRTIDGDTVHVRLESGKEEKVRFIGVDTPESTREVEPYGKEAAAYTKKRLDGRTVYLELDVGERDKYGRLLAYVWLSPPENDGEAEVRAKMFNAELLLEGYAQVMTVPPNVKYADLFVKLQREAREAEKGLWGATAGAAPAAETKYIGNARSKKFHRPDCGWAQKIAPGNRVEFKTREEAVEAGYELCKACKP